MANAIAARNLEIHEVEARFALHQSTDPAFFPEWQGVKVDLDERDRYWLDKAKSNF